MEALSSGFRQCGQIGMLALAIGLYLGSWLIARTGDTTTLAIAAAIWITLAAFTFHSFRHAKMLKVERIPSQRPYGPLTFFNLLAFAVILAVTLAGLFGLYSAPPGFETSLIDRLAFIGFVALAFYAHFRALRLILRLGRVRAEARASAADDDPE